MEELITYYTNRINKLNAALDKAETPSEKLLINCLIAENTDSLRMVVESMTEYDPDKEI